MVNHTNYIIFNVSFIIKYIKHIIQQNGYDTKLYTITFYYQKHNNSRFYSTKHYLKPF